MEPSGSVFCTHIWPCDRISRYKIKLNVAYVTGCSYTYIWEEIPNIDIHNTRRQTTYEKGVDREAPLVLQVKSWAWYLQQRGKDTPLCG